MVPAEFDLPPSPSMRKFGLAAFEDRKTQRAQYETIGDNIQSDETTELKTQIVKLQVLLRKYGKEHGSQIRESPKLREEFARLCARFGIDALSYGDAGLSSKKSSKDFYYGLGVRVIDICRRTREDNGGIISVSQMVTLLGQEKFSIHTTEADVAKAVKALGVFGPGLDIDQLPNGTAVIRSVPQELSSDHANVLMACDVMGYVTVEMLKDNMLWSLSRIQIVLDSMVSQGLLWVDTQVSPTEYWSPSSMI